MYKIICKNQTYLHDPMIGSFYTESGDKINLLKLDTVYPYLTNDDKCMDDYELINMEITHDEDYVCHVNTFDFNPEKFVASLKQTGMDFKNTVKRIILWGGEPFVNFPLFQSIVETLRKTLDYQQKIFTVKGTINDLSNADYSALHSIHDRGIKCLDCPYVMACMGQCPMLDGEDYNIRCESQKPKMKALFYSAFETIFSDEIEVIEKL